MKICPVCKTSLFDDMEVCYGCMYSFGSKPELERHASERIAQEERAQQARAQQESSPLGGWSVRLEMRNETDPTRSWSMELVPSPEPSPPAARAMAI